MKFIDLKPLSIARLKAYRKSILIKICGMDTCRCGSMGCDHEREQVKDDPNYINLCAVRDRVNKELALKQKAVYDSQQNTAHVPTVAEENRFLYRRR